MAAIRALHAGGYRVATTADTIVPPGRCSRACSAFHRVPSPAESSERFIERLHEIVASGRYEALVIGTDASLLAISENRERLEPHVAIGLPSSEVVARALSKLELSRAASAAGLRCPPMVVCESAGEARAAAREFGFPVIAKAASSVIVVGDAILRPDTRLVRGESALETWLARKPPGPSLIQGRLAGHVYSCAGVVTENGLVGFALARYLRTWPPEAGNASFAETIVPPDGLRGLIASLLDRLSWRGIFELELMRCENGEFAPIDLNPRVYGSLALTVRAGASLPTLWCDALLGRPVAQQTARPGICYRWEEGEARNLLALTRKRSTSAMFALLRPRAACVHADFSASDPGPLLARAILAARRAIVGGRAASTRRPEQRASPSAASDRTGAQTRDAPSSRTRGYPGRGSGRPVVVIGAGPYGLAVAAHLRDAGVAVRQFGRTMSYWREQMPAGMLLRSSLQSSSIADPHRALRFEHFAEAVGRPLGNPIELEQFIQYGEWFQRQAAPDLDERRVARVERDATGFRVALQDGEQLDAERVIVAAGLFPFARWPPIFAALPRAARSHASEHAELREFSGRRVAVIGSGQSALESAALLREHGAAVELLARAGAIRWLAHGTNGSAAHRRPRWPRPPTDVGGRVTGWIAATPDSFRAIPARRAREVVAFRCLRPAGAGWLPERLTEVAVSLGRTVVAAEHNDSGVQLTLDDGFTRSVDHVLLGTGYEIDVRRYPFLTGDILNELELAEGSPVLRRGLESSVRGLHFVGAPADATFGPIMRFVVGSWYAAPAVTRSVLRRRQPLLSVSY